MNAQGIFNEFTDAVGQIVIYARASKRLTKKELEELEMQTESYNARKEKYPDWFSSFDKMYFECPVSGETKMYYESIDSLEDRKRKVWLHRNKNYQWLLAEAFEAYEIFLKKLYALLGFENPSCWPLSDFGNAKLDDLKNKEYKWYLELAMKKRKVGSIIKEFRQVLPRLQKLEKDNISDINFTIALKIMEKFRHLIVHQGGRVDDYEELTKKIMDECNIRQTSEEADIVRKSLAHYIGLEEDKEIIFLLERSVSGLPKELHRNYFEELVKVMLSYSLILTNEVDKLCLENQKVSPQKS
jgi:hypothetical protein